MVAPSKLFTTNVTDEAQDVRPQPSPELLKKNFVSRGPQPRTVDDLLGLNRTEPNRKVTQPNNFLFTRSPGAQKIYNNQNPSQRLTVPQQRVRAESLYPKGPAQFRVDNNPLNGYIMVQYHVRLTMLSQSHAKKLQNVFPEEQEVNNDNLRNETADVGDAVLASTAETNTSQDTSNFQDPNPNNPNIQAPDVVNRNSDSRTGRSSKPLPPKNYYSIQSMKIDTVYAPSQANPLIATMLRIKMQIVEPHGFKLHEDIRTLAKALGYVDINPGRILYQVDVHFRGYDPDTGQWVPKIPLSPMNEIPPTLRYFVAISRIEANITNAGTVYEVDMVPAGHFAYRPEEIVISANTIFTGESVKFGDFLKNLGVQLGIAKSLSTNGIIKRTFKFHAHPILEQADFRAREFGRDHNFIREGQRGGGTIIVGKDMDILGLLQAALADIPEVNDLFINDVGNEDFSKPRVHWNIRFNTKYGSLPNQKLNDYDDITYEYIIEPFLTYKKGTVGMDTVPQYMAPESQRKRVAEVLAFNMLVRIYNYLYTAENSEVMDFNVRLKTFYYETLNEANDSAQTGGSASTNSANKTKEARLNTNQRVSAQIQIDNILDPAEKSGLIDQLFGQQKDVSSLNGLTDYDRMGGGFGVSADTILNTALLSETDSRVIRKNSYMNFLDDHLQNDLLRLEGFKIRGDPAWLLRPYANVDLDLLQAIPSSIDNNVKIYTRTGKVIFLRIFAPGQDDLMKPQVSRASDSPAIIGGFYEVYSVTSAFEDGRFYQELNGAKMNHLNFAEQMFDTSNRPIINDSVRGQTGAVQNEPQFDETQTQFLNGA